MLLIKRLTDDATIPTRAHEGDAGYDIYSSEDVEIAPKAIHKVTTGISIAIPDGHVGLLMARSSTGSRRLMPPHGAGVVDAGYRGELLCMIWNGKDEQQFIAKGERIAQLLILPCASTTMGLSEVAELPQSERGLRGFGSSGR